MSFGLARFPFVRDLSGFDFGAQPSLDKAQIREIATGRFIANGEAVTLVPFGAELSTQQAAEMLKVSRPFLVKLIETRQIPHHKVGTHRRVRAEDVLAYRQRRDRTLNAALSRLARLKQEIDG